MKFMEVLSQDSSYFTQLTRKLAPPLVTLLSAEPEIQFVALRNINLIVQKRYIRLCVIERKYNSALCKWLSVT